MLKLTAKEAYFPYSFNLKALVEYGLFNPLEFKSESVVIKGFLTVIEQTNNLLLLNLNLEDKDYTLSIDLNWNEPNVQYLIYTDEELDIYIEGYNVPPKAKEDLIDLLSSPSYIHVERK